MEFDTSVGIQAKINDMITRHEGIDIVGLSGGIAFDNLDVNGDSESRKAMAENLITPPSDDMDRNAYMYKVELMFADGRTEVIVGNTYLAEIEKDDINGQLRQPSTLTEWSNDAQYLGDQQTQFTAAVTSSTRANESFFGGNEFYQDIVQAMSEGDQNPNSPNPSSPSAEQPGNIFDARPEGGSELGIFDARPDDPPRTNIFDAPSM